MSAIPNQNALQLMASAIASPTGVPDGQFDLGSYGSLPQQQVGAGQPGANPTVPQAAVPGMNPPTPVFNDGLSVWERLSPAHLELKRQIGPQHQGKQYLDVYFGPDAIGKTPEQHFEEEKEQSFQSAALDLAMQSMNMSDEEYEGLKAQLTQLVQQRGGIRPAEVPLEAPNQAQQIAAMVASILDPQNASNYVAMPFQHGLDEQERRRKIALQVASGELDANEAQMRLTQSLMSEASSRRDGALKTVTQLQLSDDKSREKRIADARKVLADPRSTVEARQGALVALASDGVTVPESVAAGYMQPTYVQDQGQQKIDQAERKLEGQLGRWNKMNEKTDAEIENLASLKGLREEQKNYIKKRVEWFDEEMQSKIAQAYARVAAIENGMIVANGRLELDKQKLGSMTVLQAQRIRRESMGTIAATLETEAETLRSQIKTIEEGLASLAGFTDTASLARINDLRAQQNKLSERLNGQGGVLSELRKIQGGLKEIDDQLKGQAQPEQKTSGVPAPGAYQPSINSASKRFGVNPDIISAIIEAESSFRPNLTSNKGAQGLMQLMPGTARAMGVKDSFDPEQNITGGTRYFAQMMKEFGGDIELALAAYNAGPGAVRKHGGVPPYTETRNYVRKIMTRLGLTPKFATQGQSKKLKAPKTQAKAQNGPAAKSTGKSGQISSQDGKLRFNPK